MKSRYNVPLLHLQGFVASSSLPRASAWLLAHPVPRAGQAMLATSLAVCGSSCACLFLCRGHVPLLCGHFGLVGRATLYECQQAQGVAVTYRYSVVRDLSCRICKVLRMEVGGSLISRLVSQGLRVVLRTCSLEIGMGGRTLMWALQRRQRKASFRISYI